MNLDSAVSELKSQLKSKPELLQEEKEVIQKFGSLFRYDNIDNISAEEFQSFLDFKHNRHWTLHRLKTGITKDMPKLRAALKILLNESIPLEERLRRIRDNNSPDYKENMGKAVFSPILLVTNPSKYPVYNGTVERAFEKLGIKLQTEGRPIWQRYPEVQSLIINLASKYDLSLWQIDRLWWTVIGTVSYSDLVKYIKENRMQENYQPVVIKLLIENIGSGTTRELIEERLHNYNQGSSSQSMTNTVLSVLKKNSIVRKEENGYVLNISENLTKDEVNTLITLCDQKIKEYENKQSSVKYWKIAPGENASKWEEFKANGIIAIGWGEMEIGDLSRHSLNAISEEIKRHYPDSYGSIIPQFENFLSIKEGDVIIANKGISKVVGIGRVTGPYQYRSDLTYHHTYPVKWFDTKERKVIPQTGAWRKTVSIVSPELYNDIISEVKAEPEKEVENAITLEAVSMQTYFPIDVIEEIESLLNDKKQIIFYGPPGTSKTYFAKIFARYFTRSFDNVALIQFHPSYSYEDFIEGIKPNLSETGQANGFSKQDGFFKKLVKKCNTNQNSKYVLIIDEINRGNIAKIFGELIYLLDYREEKVVLTYSPNESFSIPSNLYIIGTMNSADRSIAFVDYALRRRFYFKDFYPDSNYPDKNLNLLREWFKDHPPNQINSENVIRMLEEINKVIVERLGREYQIGHSYLMKEDLDNNALRRIIDYAIIPLLEQYFFGKKERLEELKEICNRAITMPI